MSDQISVSREAGIIRIQLNRPDKKNALTFAMYQAMTSALLQAADEDVRAVLISGCADSFTSGNDIGDFVAAASRDSDDIRIPLDFLQALAACPVPVVAAVNGLAIGIGTSLLLHCDYVLASNGARLQMPFVRLGLVPEGCTSLLIPQLLGQRLAFELLVLGTGIDAERDAQLGIVNQVVSAEQLLPAAETVLEQICQLPPQAVRLSKHMLKGAQADTVSAVIESEGQLFKQRLFSREAQAAFAAFAQRSAK